MRTLAELETLLEPDQVLFSPPVQAAYSRSCLPRGTVPLAMAYPTSCRAVQEAIAWARRALIPL